MESAASQTANGQLDRINSTCPVYNNEVSDYEHWDKYIKHIKYGWHDQRASLKPRILKWSVKLNENIVEASYQLNCRHLIHRLTYVMYDKQQE
jgi:hypothetical protein